MPRIIGNKENFPIQPDQVDVSRHFFEAFNQRETEISARWIVRFIQQRGEGWKPFSYEELNTFYKKTFPHGNFTFNRLVEPGVKVLNCAAMFAGELPITELTGGGWIVKGDDEKYYATGDFVERCFKSSPAKPKS